MQYRSSPIDYILTHPTSRYEFPSVFREKLEPVDEFAENIIIASQTPVSKVNILNKRGRIVEEL